MGKLFDLLVQQGIARQRAKALGAVVAFLIIVVVVGMFVFAVLHAAGSANTTHKGLYFYVKTAKFTNASGEYYFETDVKNTGTVFINTIQITVTETGSTLGTLSSIPVGAYANLTVPVSGITNNTILLVEYSAKSGNLTYISSYPVAT